MLSYAKRQGTEASKGHGKEKVLKFTDSEMMDPKMCIHNTTHSKHIEDIDILIEFRSMVCVSQSLIEVRR